MLSEPPDLWTVTFSSSYPPRLLPLQPKFFWFVTVAARLYYLYAIHRCRKRIWSVEAMLCCAKWCWKKWKVILLRRRRMFSKMSIFRQNKAFIQRCILASFWDLTKPPVQYSIYVENRLYWLRHRPQETAWLAFVACSSLFEKLCTEPSHCQDFDHLSSIL